ncbi:MAG: helix-turn-helix domain-containing protein [Ensifer sp. SSB1]|nr:helix-turn-helix domain-containing protein [Ensifer sp. SSB1]
MPDPAEQFESMIAALRDDGLSYRQIAAEAGISHASIWRIAEGITHRPSYQTGFAIERAYRARRTDAR